MATAQLEVLKKLIPLPDGSWSTKSLVKFPHRPQIHYLLSKESPQEEKEVIYPGSQLLRCYGLGLGFKILHAPG